MHVAYAVLIHMACARPIHYSLYPKRSRTPKIFRPLTQTMILALQSVGFEMEETMAFSLSIVGRQLSPKVIRKP